MPIITFIEAKGTKYVCVAEPGLSLMKVAVANGVDGIVADCGGTCACGTCRIYIDQPWRAITGEVSEIEEAMIELHDDQIAGQRLSCQIKVTEELDGLVVRVPASQF